MITPIATSGFDLMRATRDSSSVPRGAPPSSCRLRNGTEGDAVAVRILEGRPGRVEIVGRDSHQGSLRKEPPRNRRRQVGLAQVDPDARQPGHVHAVVHEHGGAAVAPQPRNLLDRPEQVAVGHFLFPDLEEADPDPEEPPRDLDVTLDP